jgi:hypothetical protein
MPVLMLRAVGLGALPPFPGYAHLQANHQWVRYYEVDTKHQLRKCPPNAPLGCWIENGYAWGQREWYSEEFVPAGFTPKPLPAPFAHPAVHHKAAPKPVVKKKVAGPAPTYQQPFVSPMPAPAPPTQPSVTIVSPPASETAATPDVQERHERSGVGSLVGIGLFIAVGLTLLR